MTPDCRCRYLCERCGGSGKQEEGNYSYATNSYTGKAGKCQICDGTGYLGYINQQQAARLANLPGLPEHAIELAKKLLARQEANKHIDLDSKLAAADRGAIYVAYDLAHIVLNTCYPPAPATGQEEGKA